MTFWKTWLQTKLARDEKGAALVEYALLLALIAVLCIGALQIIGGESNESLTDVGNAISGA